MKKISLNFSGYWKDQNQGSVPPWAGIYCVYRGKDNGRTVSIFQLLYVGESGNVRNRITCHERRPDWRRYLQLGETLIFSVAPITSDRLKAEAAIINYHKPKLNTECQDSFPYEDIEMTLSGQIAGLTDFFTVRQFPSLMWLFTNQSPARLR